MKCRRSSQDSKLPATVQLSPRIYVMAAVTSRIHQSPTLSSKATMPSPKGSKTTQIKSECKSPFSSQLIRDVCHAPGLDAAQACAVRCFRMHTFASQSSYLFVIETHSHGINANAPERVAQRSGSPFASDTRATSPRRAGTFPLHLISLQTSMKRITDRRCRTSIDPS